MIELEFLVAGTGRSGTVFMARLLSSLGIPCGHEAVFDEHGLDTALERLRTGALTTSLVSRHDLLTNQPIPEWLHSRTPRAECSYMAAPFLDHPALARCAIVHAVRHPLAVISSFVADLGFFREGPNPSLEVYRQFVLAQVPDVAQAPTEIERASLYWVEWNEMIVRQAQGRRYLLFKVESRPGPELLDFLGVERDRVNAAFQNNAINSWNRRERDFTLADIPEGVAKQRLLSAAARFGYVLAK